MSAIKRGFQILARCVFGLLLLATLVLPASALEPVYFNSSLSLDTSFGSCCERRYVSGSYAVPEGKVLVLKHIFLDAEVPSGSKVVGRLQVTTRVNSGANFSYPPFVSEFQGVIYGDRFHASQPVTLLLTPGQSVRFYTSVTSTSGQVLLNGILSGYLIDASQATTSELPQ